MSEGRGVVFLQKDKFDLYIPAISRVVEFRFVPEIVRDLEVVNAELLENLIKLFVTSNKAMTGELIIVLSDNTGFVKDFTVASPNTPQNSSNQSNPTSAQKGNDSGQADQAKIVNDQINDFVANVPFENVAYKKFPIASGFKVLATNKDFFMAIKKAFEKVGFRVSYVFPGVVFGNNISAKQTLDIVAVNIINQQADAKRADSLLIEEKKPEIPADQTKKQVGSANYTVPEREVREKPKTNKTRMIVMLAVFGVLIIILIIMALNPPT